MTSEKHPREETSYEFIQIPLEKESEFGGGSPGWKMICTTRGQWVLAPPHQTVNLFLGERHSDLKKMLFFRFPLGEKHSIWMKAIFFNTTKILIIGSINFIIGNKLGLNI